jgi:hypothetical protein
MTRRAPQAAPYAMKPIVEPQATPHLDFYQPLFHYLHDKHEAQLSRVLLQVPLELRLKHLAPRFDERERIPHEEAWELLYLYLDVIEKEIFLIVKRHSIAYWYYLYRRIAPFLSPNHDGKTDRVTTLLVRRIAELAIVKYGNLELRSKFAPASSVKYERYMGGLYREACESVFGDGEAGRQLLRSEVDGNHLIPMGIFASDLIDLYGIEGLAYEYWRATATLRVIGKRVDVRWVREIGWFYYFFERTAPSLFKYYDDKLGGSGGLSTHFGTWFHAKKQPDGFNYFSWAQYDPGGKTRTIELTEEHGQESSLTLVPNFQVGWEVLSAFWEGHAFSEDDFKSRYGVALSAVLFAIWAISIRSTIPSKFFDDISELERERTLSARHIGLLRRGYTFHGELVPEMMKVALHLAPFLEYPLRVPEIEEAIAGAEFLSVSAERSKQIALWAGGKRYPLLPHDKVTLIDLAAIEPFIEGLFFRVGDVSKLKGAAFEESIRQYLAGEGFPLDKYGRIRWMDGLEREIDAAFRVKDTLVIFECISAERPLDFELAKPKTYEKRIQILSEKLQQAESLAKAIEVNPIGRNFDFSWAKGVEWRVLSPHHEFLWSEGPPCFTPQGQPRIVEPFAALELLKHLSG